MAGDRRPELELISSEPEHGMRYLGNEYPMLMARHISESLVRLGLNVEFIPSFNQHMSDLHVVVREDSKHPDAPPSSIGVYKVQLPNESPEKEPGWRRLHIVSQREVKQRQDMLAEVIEQRGIIDADRRKLQTAAIDWIFYENVLAVVSNACYMQQNFPNGYIGDFNGQSHYYRTERHISAEYLRQTSTSYITVEEDYESLKEGFGLMMLHESLLRKGVVAKAKMADWIIEKLRQDNQNAYRGDKITAHFEAMKPDHEVGRRIAALALEVFDPELEG